MKRLLLAVVMFLVCAGGIFAQVQRNRTVMWEYPYDISQVTEFRLYYGKTPGGPYDMGKIVVPVNSLEASVVLPKGTYYFVCTAANPDSESEYSNEASTTIWDNAQKVINLKIIVSR